MEEKWLQVHKDIKMLPSVNVYSCLLNSRPQGFVSYINIII